MIISVRDPKSRYKIASSKLSVCLSDYRFGIGQQVDPRTHRAINPISLFEGELLDLVQGAGLGQLAVVRECRGP